MLLNNFFTVIQQIETNEANNKADFPVRRFKIAIKLNPEHPVYKGHFPGNPVVPGVCQVQMIKELSSAVLNTELVIHKADNIKFLSMILPAASPLLKVDLEIREKESGIWNVSAVILNDDQVFLKLKGLMGKK